MTLDTVQFRAATAEDAEELLKLQYLCYQSEAALYGYDIQPLTQRLSEVAREIAEQLSFVATLDGLIVGGVRCRVAEGDVVLGKLVTHPRAQRRGIGSQLMAHVENAARDIPEVHAITLFTGSRSTDNLRFYQRRGYQVTHTDNAMTWMRKSID
ncbi:GNAT family N-acetyltransferase [Gordonia sp. VNK21]|uniref:GNAT family N-acetyltransferase n=1 Tax=Gordonia sp. VNK21 TaxID=3382483 RepID=UPI0038D4C82D